MKPPIKISITDFQEFAGDKAFLTKQSFVNMMREQMNNYAQSRLSSKSEFWNDSPFAFNSIGPLKYLLLDLFRMKQQMDQAAADVTSTTSKQPATASSGPKDWTKAATSGSGPVGIGNRHGDLCDRGARAAAGLRGGRGGHGPAD